MADVRFRKGDVVKFRYALRFVCGEVKEDRGPIGINGRRLYLVEFHPDALRESLFQIELPAEDLEAVPAPAPMK